MFERFLLVGLPYAAVLICLIGIFVRLKVRRFSASALSSQFLEQRKLSWGSLPWHVGIFVVLLGHLVAFLFPGLWASLVAHPRVLVGVEIVGMAAAVLAVFGLTALIVRRITHAKVQAVTSTLDLVILGVLMVQLLAGLATAAHYRWGASWATGTLAPYLWSLLWLQPKPEFVAEMPALVHVHLALAWVLVGLLPFSRLVHVIFLPLGYLIRPPLLVVWSNPRRSASLGEQVRSAPERRHFLRAAFGLVTGVTLLTVGTVNIVGRFFLGPRESQAEEVARMRTKLTRLRLAAEQKELELERKENDYIFVARLAELEPRKGKYFIDFQMRPALALLDPRTGFPNLISAKCTHLGCTVGSEVNENQQILCPCHVSWFNVHTGEPNQGSPATVPLPHVAWVLMDSAGEIVARRAPQGPVQGGLGTHDPVTLSVYIAKRLDVGSSS